MTTTAELVDQLNASTVDWIEAIQKIPDDDFNRVAENTWSPAQIFVHLILTEKGIVSILSGPSQSVDEKRASMLERVARGLNDYDRKLKAPSMLEPRPDVYDKNVLIRKFLNARNALVELLENSPELDNLFTSYPHPYFGLLTGVEWAHNVVLHANRHLLQLQRATRA